MAERQTVRGRSITSRYSIGYMILLVLALLLFAISLLANQIQYRMYDNSLDELLELNELFVEVEKTNNNLYDYFLYLRPASSEDYRREAQATRSKVDALTAKMHDTYSRETVDLCCMVQTYLEQSGELVQGLDLYTQQNPESTNATAFDAAYQDTQRVFSYINLSFKDIYSTQLADTEQMRQHISDLRNGSLLLQAILVLAALLAYLKVYQWVVKPITESLKKLTDFARSTTKLSEKQEHVQLDTGDELELFANTFNDMVDTIFTQVKQLEADAQLREQLRQAEMENLRISAELKANELALLQSRINPHFLFNTLNIITQTAQMEDAEETAALIEATADFLRYNLSKLNKVVTLADEVENTRNYVYIQKQRFGSRFTFTFEVDESCTGFTMPCMILQPLVENSIRHGLNNMLSGAQVAIRVYPGVQGSVCLEVWDNGIGISPEKQAELLRSFESTDDSGHIGLRNVYKRLKLFYGKNLKVEFDSRPGDSAVRFVLPPQEKALGPDPGTLPETI